MDESHHYRADAGFNAINELNPVLGIDYLLQQKTVRVIYLKMWYMNTH